MSFTHPIITSSSSVRNWDYTFCFSLNALPHLMSGPSTRLGERACVTTVELDGNTPFFPGLDIYVGTRVACLFDYLDNTDYNKETKDSSKYLSQNPSDRVMARAAGGDLEAFVEVAIR